MDRQCVWCEVGTGFFYYLDEYHIQRVSVKHAKKGQINETWQQNISKNKNIVAKTYKNVTSAAQQTALMATFCEKCSTCCCKPW
jgi:hypothetical protein